MEKVLLWGTGKVASEIISNEKLFCDKKIVAVVDNGSNQKGGFWNGYSLISPEQIVLFEFDSIIVLSTKYYDEICKQIIELSGDNKIKVYGKAKLYGDAITKRYSDCDNPEIRLAVDYISKNGATVFPYEFAEKYNSYPVDVFHDAESGLFYVKHKGKKLYFSKDIKTKETAASYYLSLLAEQDEKSPHKYYFDELVQFENSVVVDVGAAEGIFALELVEKASHIYIVEAENNWCKALEKTFEAYDNVKIINAFCSSFDSENQIKLDSIISRADFIKIDVEGMEEDVLLGAENLLKNSENIKCSVCCYHSDNAEYSIKYILNEYGLKTSTSDGYMWFPYAGQRKTISTKLTRGIVRGNK